MASTSAVVLITGGNRGIGFAIAQVLSESAKPYTILVGSRNLVSGDEAVSKLNSTKTNKQTTIFPITIDVSSSESITAAVNKITNDYGRLDILLNNAGIVSAPGFGVTTRSDWLTIFDVNFFGTAELTHAAFPLLRKSADPKVVVLTSNMGSINMIANGHVPIGPSGAPYSASKAAINAMLAYWVQTEKDIKFWAVCPGLCATEFGGDFSLQNGRDPRLGADVVRQCVEGEREDTIGRVNYDEERGRGTYDW